MTAADQPPRELRALRAEMDTLNERLVAVLHERARLARRIGRCKRALGIAAGDDVREQQMLDAASTSMPPDGFPPTALRGILAEVFARSRELVHDADA